MLDSDKDKRRPLIGKGAGMREEEEEPRSFARSAEQLPNPEELMPLSQSLITPDLAYAFDLPNTAPSSTAHSSPTHHHHYHHHLQLQQQAELNSELEGGGKEEAARTMKRPRLVWTPQLHKKFVDAVAQLGIKNAVPKTIMQLMGVEGLTRENVASHLQKYRLYLKRVEGDPAATSSVSATDRRLFSGAPVQQHLLLARGAPEPFAPFSPSPALQHQQQYYHQRCMGQFGSPSNTAAGFDHRFLMPVLSRPAMHSVVGNVGVGMVHCLQPLSLAPYVEDLESGIGGRGAEERRALTLFPAGDE